MRTIRVVVAASAAALVAVACADDSATPAATPGGSSTPAAASTASGSLASLPAAEILSRARTAFKQATSVHVTGGGSAGADSFKIDMRYAADGKATGSLDSGGQTVQVRRLGQLVFIKASSEFWSAAAGAQAAALFGGKYVKAPLTDKRLASVVSLTDKNSFIDGTLASTGGVTKGGTSSVNGTPAIALTIKGNNSTGSTVYVATTGQPVPLEAAPEVGGTDTGKIDFVDYGAPVDVQLPPAGQTVDVSKLPNN